MSASNYDQAQAFGGVIDVLEAQGAHYAIWGGLAVVAYGEPRFTQDMDVLLSPDNFRVDLFVRRLEETHYHVDDIASIVRIQGDNLDDETLDVAAARLGLLGVWRSLWQENRPNS